MRVFFKVLLFIVLLFLSKRAFAQNEGEGSVSLYPSGATGNRAFLMSSTTTAAFNPFPTIGRVFVYANQGDILYVGSSVQGTNGGTIRMYPPNGRGANPTKYYDSGTSTTIGRIENRAQELVGPKVQTNATLNGYVPFSRTVGAGEAGIWVIDFYSKNATSGTSTQTGINVLANNDWRTAQDDAGTGTLFIAAWNVAVWGDPDGSGPLTNRFLKGRLFTNVFCGSISGANNNGFDSDMYILTRDGFTYRVDNNGQNGLSFNFLVNNKGLMNTNAQTSTYLSTTYPAPAGSEMWDPRKLDVFDQDNAIFNITHKIFFNKPDSNLPLTASMWDATSSQMVTQWLRPQRKDPQMSSLFFIGAEGTNNQSGSKGGYVVFDSNVNGVYEIIIPFPAPYANRILKGLCSVGSNKVYWDGMDANGVKVTSGTSVSSITTQISGAEVHFPLIDVENNPNGLKIELLDANLNLFSPTRDVVYWDNTGLTLSGPNPPLQQQNNSTSGSPSATNNGHKWGVNTGGNNFGDAKIVDTWSYAPGEKQTINSVRIEVLEADLEVVSLMKTTGPNNVTIGDVVNYQAVIKNSGPINMINEKAATFFFYIPLGMTISPSAVVFAPSSGVTLESVGTFSSLPSMNVYKVLVNMPNGGEATFTIPVSVTAATSTSNVNAWAAIMRSNDVSDPNATNPDIENIPSPRDPFEEANGIHQRVENINLNASNIALTFPTLAINNSSNANYTNNIKYNNIVTSSSIANTTLSIIKTGSRVSTTNGVNATFSITVKNTGTSTSTNTILTDNLAGTRFVFTNNASNYYVTQGAISFVSNVITWNIGTLVPNAEATIVFKTAIGGGGANYTNTAVVSSNEASQKTANVTLGGTNALSDFAISKTVANHADPDKVVFTLSVTRVSGGTSSIKVSDKLPPGYTYQSHATGSGTAAYDTANGLIWDVGSINNATPRTLTLTATINSPTNTQDEFLNKTQITSSTLPESDLSNNTAQVEIKADLRVDKSVNNSSPAVGTNVVFTIIARNFTRAGYNHATGVAVEDVLPSGFSYVGHTVSAGTYDTTTGIWSIGNLAQGGLQTMTITAKVKPTGSYINIANITGGQKDDFMSNNISIVTLTPLAAIKLITNPMIRQRVK